MTVEEYCKEYGANEGYGLALIERATDRIITPYCGRWSYPDEDAIEQLEIDEQSGVTVDGRYILALHSGYYELKYSQQENHNV